MSDKITPNALTTFDNVRINGNLGIGIDPPNYVPLYVYSAGAKVPEDNYPVVVVRIQSSVTYKPNPTDPNKPPLPNDFGACRLAFRSGNGTDNEWRPGYIESTDNGTFTGGLAFYVNGSGAEHKFGAVEVMRLVNGNVGIGTTNPEAKLHIFDPSIPSFRGSIKLLTTSGVGHDFSYDGGIDNNFWFTHYGQETGETRFKWDNGTKTTELLALKNTGLVGIGTTTPSEKLEVAGNVKCVKLIETSSRELKENIAAISASEAIKTLENFNAVKFNYKADSEKNLHIGFIAEDVPDLVATSDRKGLSAMDIVAVLTQVVKEQQKTMVALAEKVKLLEDQPINI